MERMISVSDVTMKQAVGLSGESLSFRQKIELAKLLDRIGVSVIESAPLKNGKSDSLLVKSLASAVKDSVLAVPVDIMDPDSIHLTWNALCAAAHPRLQVCVPVSTVQMEYLCHRKPADILGLIRSQVSALVRLIRASFSFTRTLVTSLGVATPSSNMTSTSWLSVSSRAQYCRASSCLCCRETTRQ